MFTWTSFLFCLLIVDFDFVLVNMKRREPQMAWDCIVKICGSLIFIHACLPDSFTHSFSQMGSVPLFMSVMGLLKKEYDLFQHVSLYLYESWRYLLAFLHLGYPCIRYTIVPEILIIAPCTSGNLSRTETRFQGPYSLGTIAEDPNLLS